MRRTRAAETAALIVAMTAMTALSPVSAAAQAQAASPAVTVSYEIDRDRFQYRFENPSTFDTPELVPHNFTQTYWGDNQWALVSARYRIGRGDLATSGTSGNVDRRSWRVRHTVALGRKFGLDWRSAYQYRRDRSAFHARQTKTVSHTQPPSTSSFTIEGSETTISEIHDFRVGFARQWDPGRGWRVEAGVDASPATVARLTTILPIKYPGREIVFSVLVMTLNPALTISRDMGLPVTLSVASTQTFSYDDARRFKRRAITASVGVGLP